MVTFRAYGATAALIASCACIHFPCSPRTTDQVGMASLPRDSVPRESAGDVAGVDAHLLAVFTPADAIGHDGREHVPLPR